MKLSHRRRALFSLKPDWVRSAIPRTSFDGVGPQDFARPGSSRDGQPPNLPVIVGRVRVAGGPIAPHVWAGNRLDHSTVHAVVRDLPTRFQFGRRVFVGDRGMVTDENWESFTNEGHGSRGGLKRRRNDPLDEGHAALAEAKGIDCPVGITAPERTHPPRTRAHEVPSGVPDSRGIIGDSEERRTSEQAMRQRSMERTRAELQKLKERGAAGQWKQPEKIGAAAERILQRHQGSRS